MSAIGTKPITVKEFLAMPEPTDGSKQELLRGEIITMTPPKLRHGFVQVRIAVLLSAHVDANRLGWVVTESGAQNEEQPDTLLGPDVSFYSVAQHAALPDEYSGTPPQLVAEVLSPSDRRGTVRDKVREYLRMGVRLVWVVDPETRTTLVYAGTMRGTELDETDPITGGDVLPSFSCKVADFFA